MFGFCFSFYSHPFRLLGVDTAEKNAVVLLGLTCDTEKVERPYFFLLRHELYMNVPVSVGGVLAKTLV